MEMRSTCCWAVSVLVFCLVAQVSSSAIPMWEFLTRDEKVSHLYRVFSKQVAKYCSNSPLPDCSKSLMITGVRNLANMDNNMLDELDPYQHAAKQIIWRALSNGVTTSQTEQEPNNSFYPNEADDSGVNDNGTNRLADDQVEPKKGAEVPFSDQPGPYIIGPLVVRVLPDGRPVPGDEKRPLPKDEDLEDLRVERIPFIEQFDRKNRRFSTAGYRKPMRYTQNTLPTRAFDYHRRYSGHFGEARPYYGPKEIPRYRRFVMNF